MLRTCEVREAVVLDYGMQVFAHGLVYHSDRRWRVHGTRELVREPKSRRVTRDRGKVRGFTRESQRRLEFVAANAATVFRTFLTLTYHALGVSWDDPTRNGEVARRSKRDLNRFLSCLRRELGGYIWAREFQERGVVHYHVLAEKEIECERVKVAWGRASGELDDPEAMVHAAQVEKPKEERGARHYLGRYLGKEKQKLLPPGVERAGRWWGRSRSMPLALLAESVTATKGDGELDPVAVRVVRGVRAYVTKRLGWKFRGGRFVNWGGALCDDVRRVMAELEEFHGARVAQRASAGRES